MLKLALAQLIGCQVLWASAKTTGEEANFSFGDYAEIIPTIPRKVMTYKIVSKKHGDDVALSINSTGKLTLSSVETPFEEQIWGMSFELRNGFYEMSMRNYCHKIDLNFNCINRRPVAGRDVFGPTTFIREHINESDYFYLKSKEDGKYLSFNPQELKSGKFAATGPYEDPEYRMIKIIFICDKVPSLMTFGNLASKDAALRVVIESEMWYQQRFQFALSAGQFGKAYAMGREGVQGQLFKDWSLSEAKKAIKSFVRQQVYLQDDEAALELAQLMEGFVDTPAHAELLTYLDTNRTKAQQLYSGFLANPEIQVITPEIKTIMLRQLFADIN